MRAVLAGVAERGADLVDAARVETGLALDELRVDGGMTASPFLLQSLADATGSASPCRPSARPRPVAPDSWPSSAPATSRSMTSKDSGGPPRSIAPRWTSPNAPRARDQWRATVERVRATIPELSAIAF